ncbi:TonB-dependent receptor, partial [archaeon]|nr:TonB-dependent receptor [archaeon]NDB80122.1 TonB-dependent receptor [archaeon]
YGTGNAVTIAQGYIDGNSHQLSSFPIVWDPTLQGQFSGAYIDYGSRNDFRMESYHRLDLGVQFHKEKEKGTAIWEISVYNAYNRANPFFYYGTYQYNSNTNKEYVGLSKIALFPLIPSVSYTFKFK